MQRVAHFFALAVLAANFALSPSADSAVTVVGWWRMGENDPGAASGMAVTNTVDIVNSNNLVVDGSAFYTSDVSAAANLETGSTLSVLFTNGAYATCGLIPNLTDNFGVELWVNPATNTSEQSILYNGDSSTSGWGLFATGNAFSGLFGGVSFIFGSVPFVTGTWYHVALVEADGTATLYVNGAVSATLGRSPNSPTGQMTVGSSFSGFSGLIDEIRVFTFASGQFSTNDLLLLQGYAPPDVSSVSAGSVTLDPTTGLGSVTVSASVNPNGSSASTWVQYGPRTNYGISSATLWTGYAVTNTPVSVVLTKLTPGTSIHFNVVASNAEGANFSPDQIVNISQPGDFDGDGMVSAAELNSVYAAYLPTSPWLYLTNVAGLGGTNVTFALTNSLAATYTVQYSTNLENWYDLGSATPRYLFVDTNAPAIPQRYYRLTYP